MTNETRLSEGPWHRVHPLSPVVRAGRALIALLFLLAPSLVSGNRDVWGSAGHLGTAGILVVVGLVAWLVTRWRIHEGALQVETGLIRRRSLRFPLARIQAIDTVRPGLARVFGLAELRLRMAGGSGSSGRLAYLPARDAEALRARLLALAHGLPEETVEPPEHVLGSIPTGRLVASILLSRFGLVVETLFVALLVTAAVSTSAARGVIGASAFVLVGLGIGLWRRFNGEYGLTVAEAPDGLRLRAGLVATTAETIPRGRVQAVRMVEPLLWRPLGWCRLEVDVAGRKRAKGESEAAGHQLRALLPVGSVAEARALLARILPDTPTELSAAPRRARLKAPLSYRNLSWSRSDAVVVTTHGRLARVTVWVPLAKVQSLRHAQGPVQRRLGLATVHLDTAGRNLRASLRDRDVAEADAALADLVVLCRLARRAEPHVNLRAAAAAGLP